MEQSSREFWIENIDTQFPSIEIERERGERMDKQINMDRDIKSNQGK